MGLETKQSTEENQKSILSISSDQMFPGDKSQDAGETPPPTPNKSESAAISMAKQAAGEAMKSVGKAQVADAKIEKIKEKELKKEANVEIDQSAELDASTIAEIEALNDEGHDIKNSLVEDKAEVIEEEPADAKKDSTKEQDDLSVPKWPKYSDPVA